MDGGPESPAAALAASSATQRKWASFVLLGPLLPSLFAIVLIVVGGAIVKGDTIDEDATPSCGYPIDTFIEAAIANSYLFLAVFAWSFLGFETHFSIRGRRRRFLRPFSSLSFVALLYFLLFVMSVIIWSIGTWAVIMDIEGENCSSTVPLLYTFSSAVVAIYWIGVLFGGTALVGTIFGKQLKTGAKSTLQMAKTYVEERDKKDILDAERLVVARKFDDLDEEGNGSIEREQAEGLISELGLGLSGKKLKKALAQLDSGGEGVVSKEDFLNWYTDNFQEE